MVYVDEAFGELNCAELIVRYAAAAKTATIGTTMATLRVESVPRPRFNLGWNYSSHGIKRFATENDCALEMETLLMTVSTPLCRTFLSACKCILGVVLQWIGELQHRIDPSVG